MNKKEYIISILKKMEPYWNMVGGIIAMIELWDESDIDVIIKIIWKHIDSIEDKQTKDKLLKMKNLIIEIQNKENNEKKIEQIEITNLLQQINNL